MEQDCCGKIFCRDKNCGNGKLIECLEVRGKPIEVEHKVKRVRFSKKKIIPVIEPVVEVVELSDSPDLC